MPGADTLKILAEREDRALDTCATCPSLCRWSCPVAETEARETTSPQRLGVLAQLLKQDRLRPDQTDGAPYHCTHCLACTEACLHDNDVGLIISAARARLLDAQASPKGVRHVSGAFAVAGNAVGRRIDDALSEAVDAAGFRMEAYAPRVYWPGCEVLSTGPEAAGDALRATALSGLPSVSVLPASAGCCGLPLYWAGELDGFRAHAARFADQFSQVEVVIAHDPTCAHAIRTIYPMLGIAFKPQITTIVEQLAPAWPAASGRSAPPAYIDGCSQARGLREVDEPRRLLAKAVGASPVELAVATGTSVDCCGGQGLLPELVPATAEGMAHARIDAFRASGAELLLTASPRCRSHLRKVDPGLPVYDLVGWLAGR
ncbi:MAG: (Fe-S)-binding protein [Myxococcota bacterium]